MLKPVAGPIPVRVVDEHPDVLRRGEVRQDRLERAEVVHVHAPSGHALGPVGGPPAARHLLEPVRPPEGDDAPRCRAAPRIGPAEEARGTCNYRPSGPISRRGRRGRPGSQTVLPPSMTRLWPVMYEDASEQRKTIAARYSSARAMRPRGNPRAGFSTKSSACPAATPSGREGVDPAAVGRPVGREVPGQADQARLHHGVGHRLHGLLLVGKPVEAVEALVGGDQGRDQRRCSRSCPAPAGHLRAAT